MRRLSIALLLLCSATGFSRISIGPPPLGPRLDQADVVCVCSLDPAYGSHAEDLPSHIPDYDLRVLRSYKAAHEGETLRASSPGEIRLVAGVRYILLMGRAPDGRGLLLVDAFIVPDDFLTRTASAAHPSVEGNLDDYLSSPPGSVPAAEVERVLDLLDGYTTLSPRSEQTISGLTNSANDRLALLSTLLLLRRNVDPAHLFPLLLSRLESLPPARYGYVGDLGFVFIQNAQPSFIGQFETLASFERPPGLRQAALDALRKLADSGTTVFLIKELDAPDSDSQYQALITLAEIHHKGGDYGPGFGPFKQDKERYIRLWKEWYRDRQSH